MTKVLTPIAALAFAFGVQAAVVSTETFDGADDAGTSVTNRTGWSFTPGADLADDASVITAYESGTAPTGSLLPDGLSAGANFLTLSTEDGTLFRNMDGTTGNSVDLNAGLFVDTDVQFTITDPSDRPVPVTTGADTDKFILWLEDQGGETNLCAWAYQFDASGTPTTNAYTLCDSNGDSLGIVPGEWHRLTVKAIANANAGGTALPSFQVYLDGDLVYTRAFAVPEGAFLSGLDSTLQTLINDKKILPAMASTMTTLSKVGFSGEGKIDSVAVTHDIPEDFDDLPRTAITFSWDSPAIASVAIGAPFNTTVTSGSLLTVTPGQTFTMTVTYASGCSASTHDVTAASGNNYATVDGMAVTADSAGAVTIAFTATAKDTVDVTFNWAALKTALSEDVGDFTGISFTYGETVVTPDISNPRKVSETISGLKVGTNVTVAVTFSTQSWRAFFSAAETDYVSTNGMVVTVIARPTSGATTVSISAEAAGPAVPEITPSASSETGATYTSAQADDIVNAINNNKSTYIKAPTGITDATYASKFVASKVEVNGSYKIVVSLTSEAQTALQTDADAKAQSLAASLAGIAAGTVTEVSVTGATPGFYYMVAYDTAVGGTYATKGTAGLASDAGAVTLTVPAKASGATAGFYKIVVDVEAN